MGNERSARKRRSRNTELISGEDERDHRKGRNQEFRGREEIVEGMERLKMKDLSEMEK
jgi:hypothetical protein